MIPLVPCANSRCVSFGTPRLFSPCLTISSKTAEVCRVRVCALVTGNLSWKTTLLAITMWSLKTGGLWWQVQLHWNVGPSARSRWSFKIGSLSWQWSLKTGFTVYVRADIPVMVIPKTVYTIFGNTKIYTSNIVSPVSTCLCDIISTQGYAPL